MISLVSSAPSNRENGGGEGGGGARRWRNKEENDSIGRSPFYPLDFFASSGEGGLMNGESDEKKVNYRAHIYERARARRGPKETGRSLGGIQINGTTYHS